MQSKYFFQLSILLLVIVLQSCSTSYKYSYEKAHFPSYTDDFRFEKEFKDTSSTSLIKVVSFNIEFAQNIEGAIALFLLEPLRSADVILLQEMDEKGTVELANHLCMNYVYYPAIYHPKHKQDVGNAILTKWKINNSQKLKLPHPSSYPIPFKGKNYLFRKTATVAEIEIRGDIIKFASTHAAAFNTTQKRREFAQALATVMDESTVDLAVVGGDFNSLGSADIHATTSSFTSKGFDWASEDIGMTVSSKKSILNLVPSSAFQLDHLFVKGMKVRDVGKVAQIEVSDHLPIWVELEIVNEPIVKTISSSK
jgi:endonuclease/exonuclease/phosphatase family metal-dependent hydrolase